VGHCAGACPLRFQTGVVRRLLQKNKAANHEKETGAGSRDAIFKNVVIVDHQLSENGPQQDNEGQSVGLSQREDGFAAGGRLEEAKHSEFGVHAAEFRRSVKQN